MKKNTMKKVITMALAAMTTMSVMSINVGAVENSKELVTVYSYDEITDSFDVSYEYVDKNSINCRRSNNTFAFSQRITSSAFTLLRNTGTAHQLGSQYYSLEDSNKLWINLEDYDNTTYYFKIFKYENGVANELSPSNNRVLSTPTCYVSGLSQGYAYSVSLKKLGSAYTTTGTLSR